MTKSTFLLGFWGILGSHFFSEDWLVQGNTSLILRKSSQQTHLPKADFHRCSDHHNNMTIWRFDSNSQAQTQRCWDSFFFAPEIDSILQNPLDFRAKNHRTWLNTKTKNHQTSQNKDSADFTSTMTSPCEKHPPGGTGYSALIFSQLRHEVRLSIQKICLQKTSSGTFCWGKWSCWCFLARIFFGFLFLPEKRRVEKRNNFSPADSSFFWKTFWEMFFLGEEERGPILGGERKSCFTDLEASFPHSARQTSHWEFLLEDMLVRWRVPLCWTCACPKLIFLISGLHESLWFFNWILGPQVRFIHQKSAQNFVERWGVTVTLRSLRNASPNELSTRRSNPTKIVSNQSKQMNFCQNHFILEP